MENKVCIELDGKSVEVILNVLAEQFDINELHINHLMEKCRDLEQKISELSKEDEF